MGLTNLILLFILVTLVTSFFSYFTVKKKEETPEIMFLRWVFAFVVLIFILWVLDYFQFPTFLYKY